ncbi:hypothetical protein PMIN06_005513 [Paraphaeosphaeria minitans]
MRAALSSEQRVASGAGPRAASLGLGWLLDERYAPTTLLPTSFLFLQQTALCFSPSTRMSPKSPPATHQPRQFHRLPRHAACGCCVIHLELLPLDPSASRTADSTPESK